MRFFLQKKHTSAAVITLILSFTATTQSKLSTFVVPSAIAQSSESGSFSEPASLPSGTQVKIDGSSSMDAINQALKQGFEKKYSGTSVQVKTSSTDAALQAVKSGAVDLAAIGRGLLPAEQSAGLKTVPVSLHKIAIIVGPDNAFKGRSLTIDQFVKIFRGEITNWSQVGGANLPIRFIDHPANSDIRQAFQRYPVFQKAPFVTGKNAEQAAQDTLDAVVQKLGKDGIGYAIADQVINNPKVSVILLHQAPPTDAKYAFSQPLAYVYKGASPKPGASAFLGYAESPNNDAVIESARQKGFSGSGAGSPVVTSSPTAVTSPVTSSSTTTGTETASTPTSTSASGNGGFNPWWLAPLALVPILWWGLGRSRDDNSRDEAPGLSPNTVGSSPPDRFVPPSNDLVPPSIQTPPAPKTFLSHDEELTSNLEPTAQGRTTNGSPLLEEETTDSIPATEPTIATTMTRLGDDELPDSRLILTPRGSHQAYAYWEISTPHRAEWMRAGSPPLELRVFDVSELGMADQLPLEQLPTEQDNDLIIPLSVSDRDYQTELGYRNVQGDWVSLAQSNPIQIQADNSINALFAGAAVTIAGVGAGIAGLASQSINTLKDAASSTIEGAETFLGGLGEKAEHAKDAAGDAFSGVVDSAETVIAGLGNKVEDAKDAAGDAFSGLVDGSETVVSRLDEKAEQTRDTANQALGGLASSAETTVAGLGEAVTQSGNTFKNQVSDLPQKFYPSGSLFDDDLDDTASADPQGSNAGISAMGTTAIGAAAAGIVGGLGALADKTESTSQGVEEAFIDKVHDTEDSVRSEITKIRDPGQSSIEPSASERDLSVNTVLSVGNAETEVAVNLPSRADTAQGTAGSQVLFMARGSTEGYAYWELSNTDKAVFTSEGSAALKLRLLDVTGLASKGESPRSVYQIDCDASDRDQHISIPVTDRDYIVEIGYTQEDGRWTALASSEEVHFSSEITRLL